jgi:RHS repeat-associated protein
MFQDNALQQLTHTVGATAISRFNYTKSGPADRYTTWSQQIGVQSPSVHHLTYDGVDQLAFVAVTNAGALIKTFAYSYDPAANRLTEAIDGATNTAFHNVLNQITKTSGSALTVVSNEWDAAQRLAAVNAGNQRTEFAYDGLGRRVGIRRLVNGSEVSNRRFVWCDNDICEERDGAGVVRKRFFSEGVKIESGPQSGVFVYTRDHLNSIRELIDTSGTVRARYSYDPFGRSTKLSGDVESDFGFGGMFWSGETSLNLTLFRAYDANAGRWLSRDPLENAEMSQGPNLYAYVLNNPVNLTDILGLCCEKEAKDVNDAFRKAYECSDKHSKDDPNAYHIVDGPCRPLWHKWFNAQLKLNECLKKPCKPPGDCKPKKKK